MWQGSKNQGFSFPSFFFFLLPLLLLPPPSLSPSLCFLSPWLEIEPRTLPTLVPFSTPSPLPGWEIKRKGHVKCTLLGMWSRNGSFLPKSWAAFQGLQVRASTRPRWDRQEQACSGQCSLSQLTRFLLQSFQGNVYSAYLPEPKVAWNSWCKPNATQNDQKSSI